MEWLIRARSRRICRMRARSLLSLSGSFLQSKQVHLERYIVYWIKKVFIHYLRLQRQFWSIMQRLVILVSMKRTKLKECCTKYLLIDSWLFNIAKCNAVMLGERYGLGVQDPLTELLLCITLKILKAYWRNVLSNCSLDSQGWHLWGRKIVWAVAFISVVGAEQLVRSQLLMPTPPKQLL